MFTPEELATIKNFGEPGLVLFGFKDKKSLGITHNIKHSSFILPNEKVKNYFLVLTFILSIRL